MGVAFAAFCCICCIKLHLQHTPGWRRTLVTDVTRSLGHFGTGWKTGRKENGVTEVGRSRGAATRADAPQKTNASAIEGDGRSICFGKSMILFLVLPCHSTTLASVGFNCFRPPKARMRACGSCALQNSCASSAGSSATGECGGATCAAWPICVPALAGADGELRVRATDSSGT